jgi:hypothetical protein
MPLHDPKCLPALFATLNTNLTRQRERVSEHARGDIEANRAVSPEEVIADRGR